MICPVILSRVRFGVTFAKIEENHENAKMPKKFGNKPKKHRNLTISMLYVGAAGQIRTADLILTKNEVYVFNLVKTCKIVIAIPLCKA